MKLELNTAEELVNKSMIALGLLGIWRARGYTTILNKGLQPSGATWSRVGEKEVVDSDQYHYRLEVCKKQNAMEDMIADI